MIFYQCVKLKAKAKSKKEYAMFLRDKITGEKIILKDLRCLELKFSKVFKKNGRYILRNCENVFIAEINRNQLDKKTIAKLDGLAEFKP